MAFLIKILIPTLVYSYCDVDKSMTHQCYYCDQIFDSKEKLFDHLEVHSDSKDRQSSNTGERS